MSALGLLADILTSPRHVRFTPSNGRWAAHPSQHLSADDMILFALEQALREVWAVLKAHDLQQAIADKLMALADSA